MNIALPARLALLAIAALPFGQASAAPFGPVVAPHQMSELTPVATLHVGKTADWVVITSDAVWVGSTGPYAVHRIDPLQNKRVATVKLGGEPCAGMTSGFGSLWIPLCGKSPALAKVDLKTGTLSKVFKVGPAGPEGGIATSETGVWMVLDKHGKLARIDPDSGKVVQTVQIHAGSYNPRYGGGRIWVTRAEGSEVTAVDAQSGKVVATVQSGPGPRFLGGDDQHIWTLNQGDGSVTAIDTGSAQVSRTVALGIPGRGGDIALYGDLVWTTMPKVPLSAVDVNTGTVACQWVGAGGDSMAIGHGAIWLTDYTGGTISRIDLDDIRKRCQQPPGT